MLPYMGMIYPDIKLESELWSKGLKYVVGLDEAGRGPLAGPVVAGAVVITAPDQVVESVRDSKKMTVKQREKAYDDICRLSTAYAVGIVDSKEIDVLGIREAVHQAMISALRGVEKKLGCKVDYIIADGGILLIDGYDMQAMNHGDLYHYSISSASVLAKVTRDRIMKEYAKKFPEYGFDTHVGYGTKKHIEAIKEFGVCDIHRRTFEPIKSMVKRVG